MRKTDDSVTDQSCYHQQNNDTLDTAEERSSYQIQSDDSYNQRESALNWLYIEQDMKIVAKTKNNIPTNKEPGAYIGPPHQKAPMAAQDCLHRGIASTCKRIATGELRIRYCNQYCRKKGQTKGEKRSWSR